jgi:predicted small lipoprotein YifL
MRFRFYGVGEYHPPHLDTYQIGDSTLILTALITLTNVGGGGETYFPDAKPKPLYFPPEAGRLILWFGHLPNGEIDQLSLHESKPVVDGKKLTLTYFFYQSLECARLGIKAEGC